MQQRMRKTTAAVCGLVVAMLAACGGGGGDDGASLNGTMGSVSGQINPDPVTATQPLILTFTARFVGQVTPAASSFGVPFTVTRDGADRATGTATFALQTGQPGNGTFTGSANLTLPADGAVGTHTYCVRLNPAATYAYNGTVQAAQCTVVTISPS